MVFVPQEFIPEYRTARKYSLLSADGWWFNKWPLLGWLETFVKVAAWCFVPYIPVPDAPFVPFDEISKPFAIETATMLLASALITAAIIDRLVYREIVSMIFVFPNNWAHWTVTAAMYRSGRDGINVRYFRIFCWLMFAGDIVKLVFFAVHDFSRLNVARYVRSVSFRAEQLLSNATIFCGNSNDWGLKSLYSTFLAAKPLAVHADDPYLFSLITSTRKSWLGTIPAGRFLCTFVCHRIVCRLWLLRVKGFESLWISTSRFSVRIPSSLRNAVPLGMG